MLHDRASRLRRGSPWLFVFLALVTLVFGVQRVHAATIARSGHHAIGLQPPHQQSSALQPFQATGLPAGAATGVPVHASFPAGTTLKHTHGGPTYVYIIAGSLDIVEADGSSTTYEAGSFLWESPGHIHTLQVRQGVEVFYLQFLPPGAEGTIPVQ